MAQARRNPVCRVTVPVLMTLWACTLRSSQQSSAPATGEQLLPAGTYWTVHSPCEECPRPAVATAFVFSDAESARPIVRSLEGRLPVGYPLVVHSSELPASTLRLDGVVVVLGLHRSWSDAQAYRGRYDGLTGATIVALDVNQAPSEPARMVVRVDRGRPVSAYSVSDVDSLDDGDDGWQTLEEYYDSEPRARGLRPLCYVAPGDFFVAKAADIRERAWAPVRCGEQRAYVPFRRTLLGSATILADGRGGHVLRQITLVECDVPTISEWSYGRNGRGAVQRNIRPGCPG